MTAHEPHIEPDARLVEKALAGDESAFTALVRRHAPWLVSWIRVRLAAGSRDDAEDLAQEVFVVLNRNMARVRKRDCLASYLKGVAKRILWAESRRKEQRREAETTIAREAVLEGSSLTVNWRSLRTSLHALPDELELALEVYYSSPGITYEGAARILGVTRATIQSRLRRAMELLRERMEQE